MTNSTTTIVTLTDKAKEHLINISKSQEKPYVLFGVDGGGCAGFSYYWKVDDKYDEEGELIDLGDGVGLAVDSASMMYVLGSNIDYVSDIMGSTIQVENPLARSSCGCGESISFDF